MMNRKLLAMAVTGLLSVAGLSAQEPQLKWVTSQDGMGLEIPHAIKASSDGAVFPMNDFAASAKETTYDPDGEISKGFSLTTDYFFYNMADGTKVSEKTSTGVPDVQYVNGSYNMTLYKVGTDGHLQWGIYTNVGEFSSGAMAPTSDGGVMIALKMRHSSCATYKTDIICQLVDANGVENAVKWDAPDYSTYGGVYQPILAKISKDGKVEWTKRVDVSYKTVTVGGTLKKLFNNFELGDMATDEADNIYLTGTYRTSINFGRNANLSSPHNAEGWDGDTQKTCSDLFVVKLDKAGTAQWNVVTKGQVINYEIPKSIVYDNGNLYLSGYMKGDGESTVTLGSNRLTPTNRDCLFYANIAPADGSVKWARLLQTVDHPVTKAGARMKPMCLTASGNDLYMGGSFYGNVMDGEKLCLENPNKQTNGLRAFVLKCSAVDGAVQTGTLIDGGLTEVESIILKDGNLLASGYDLYAASYLYTLDTDLTANSLKSYPLKQSALTATQGATVVGNLLVSAMNANRTATFPGCDWELKVINNGDSNYRACVFTGHDISSLSTGIASAPVADNGFRAYAGKGELIVETASACRVQVFGIDGRMVLSFEAPKGRTAQSLPAGLYIVNDRKVAVY